MAVCAQQGFAGYTKALHMDLVRYAVACPAKMDAVSCRGRPEKPVIVGILEIRVQDIVVHVLDRQFYFNGGKPQCFEFEHGEGTGRVLKQGMVDCDADLLARHEFALDEMITEYLLNKVSFQDIAIERPLRENMSVYLG
jgi:hypothetical protein